jgi:alanine transaminase
MKYTRAFVTAAASFADHHRRGGGITFSSSSSSSIGMQESSNPTIPELLRRARTLRNELYGKDSTTSSAATLPSFIFDSEQLAYPLSSYEMKIEDDRRRITDRSVRRGFCNWLIPHKIMIGQYPGMTPEINGASSKECTIHIQNMIQHAKINMFCCLQTEVPPQDDDFEWAGEVYLEPMSIRREFPRPFTRYSTLAQGFLSDTSDDSSTICFIHSPIEDLSTPSCNDDLLGLLSTLLQHLESDSDNNTLYLHCWGGRGRAGLIGGLMGSLLFPELSSQEVLTWVQAGYDTRLGAKSMHPGLRRSPQTEQQREFVREFVTLVKDAHEKM